MTLVQLIERYNALAANGCENWVVRRDWPKVLGEFIGTCGNTCYGEGESARRSEPQEEASSERIHDGPSKHRPKTILSLMEIVAYIFNERCGICHAPTRGQVGAVR